MEIKDLTFPLFAVENNERYALKMARKEMRDRRGDHYLCLCLETLAERDVITESKSAKLRGKISASLAGNTYLTARLRDIGGGYRSSMSNQELRIVWIDKLLEQ